MVLAAGCCCAVLFDLEPRSLAEHKKYGSQLALPSGSQNRMAAIAWRS